MSEKEERHERPCLHCLIVELIDEFFAEYPATSGALDNVDTDGSSVSSSGWSFMCAAPAATACFAIFNAIRQVIPAHSNDEEERTQFRLSSSSFATR